MKSELIRAADYAASFIGTAFIVGAFIGGMAAGGLLVISAVIWAINAVAGLCQ